MSPDVFHLGVDVGTGSVRAGIFDLDGLRLGMATHPITTWKTQDDFVEQSSDDIWAACGAAVRGALAEAGLAAKRIRGVGFDATCSLVALDAADRPVSVSPTGDDRRNVVVWMDHRAVEQAKRINDTGLEALRYVGGALSPEMQLPKLLWLKENLPRAWQRTRRFLDLPDFLSYRATGVDTRSLCTTVCKWTYLGHGVAGEGSVGRWDPESFRRAGLGELADEGFARIGTRVRPQGERVGELTARAAGELGLAAGVAIAVSIIDAHAGGLGLLGVPLDGEGPEAVDLETRLALIGGTSSCHLAVSGEPRFIPGVWGPYFSAMIPDRWLTEGGQSATGALIDHTIQSHVRGAELSEEARRQGSTPAALLNQRLDVLAAGAPFPAAVTQDLHVLPDHHGNRSPRADPSLRGMVSGLRVSDSLDALALLYLSTIQGIAHGTRHIVDTLNAAGYRIRTLIACGGDTKNAVFVREHADATGCRVVLPREPESVLLGAAMLGAAASGACPSLLAAMGTLNAAGAVVEPAAGASARYHEAKHSVFQRMYGDQMAYRQLMGAATAQE